MRTSTAHRADAGQSSWRPSAWGALGSLGALGGAAAVGREAAQAWVGAGADGFAADLLGALLALASALLVWVAAVLIAAAWHVRPDARPAGAARSRSAAVRVAAAVLVSLGAGVAGGAGAHAAPAFASTLSASEGALPEHPAPGPAQASDDGPASARGDGSESLDVPLPGWTPRMPSSESRPPGQIGLVSGAPADDLPESVVVRRGDTLWDLAARSLGPGATSADIAEEWPRWYAANLATIGPDPDLLLPGQELGVPGASEGRR